MPRFLKANELTRIWINKKPDTFMPMLNQLRLIQLRVSNPTAKITLITATNDPKTGTPFLTPEASGVLKKFCALHKIELLEVSSLPPLLQEKTEKKLFEKICAEIAAARNDTGGSLAAASDMLRALPQILRLGIYSDFDTKIKISDLPDIVPIETTSPILYSGHRYISEEESKRRNIGMETNIDLLVPTFCDAACSELDEKFLGHCKRVQITILNRYKNLAKVFQDSPFFNAAMQIPAVKAQLSPLLEQQDIFRIRRWFSVNLTYKVWWDIKKQEMYTTVTDELTPPLQACAAAIKVPFPDLLRLLERSDTLCANIAKKIGCAPNFIKFFTNTHQVEDLRTCQLHELMQLKKETLTDVDEISEVDLTQYERALSMSTKEWVQHQYTTACHELLKQSVRSVTGPYSWSALFRSDMDMLTPKDLQRLDASAIAAQTVYTRSGRRAPLSQFLWSLQTPYAQYDRGVLYQVKQCIEDCLGQDSGADCSWLPSGERILSTQNDKMDQAARTLQHAYRHHHAAASKRMAKP